MKKLLSEDSQSWLLRLSYFHLHPYGCYGGGLSYLILVTGRILEKGHVSLAKRSVEFLNSFGTIKIQSSIEAFAILLPEIKSFHLEGSHSFSSPTPPGNA